MSHIPTALKSLGIVLLLLCISGCANGNVARVHPTPTPVLPADDSANGNGLGTVSHSWLRLSHDELVASANAYMAKMSVDQKIGQLLDVEISSVGYNGDTPELIKQVQPGAVIVYDSNLPDANTAIQLTSGIQRDSPIPVLTTIDEEGNYEDRLHFIYPQPPPTATQVGATNNTTYAYQIGSMVAQRMLAVGINTDLAPDVDVQTIDGPDQSTRTFGTTAAEVSKMAGAWMNGLQEQGAIATLKHFPGLGDANCDAHLCLPLIQETKDQIEQIDLAPYRALLASPEPPGIVMSTDLLMPAIDGSLPAELSPATITGVLRGELGYDGVVITDALYMKGVFATQFPTADLAGVQALIAGCDLLVGAFGAAQAEQWVTTIKNAIASGKLTQARIDQSVQRILILKIQRGLLAAVPNTPAPGVRALAFQLTPAARRED